MLEEERGGGYFEEGEGEISEKVEEDFKKEEERNISRSGLGYEE